jgi:molecular chaperone DnaJ
MSARRQKDYYQVLGVAPEADTKTIKNAFRRLAMKYHPDRNKEPDAEEWFKEIAEAYAVLSDPKKRAQYDARGHAGIADFSTEDLFGGIDFEELFGGHDFGFDFGLGGGSSFFDRIFRTPRESSRPRGANIEERLDVPLKTVARGGEETLRFQRHTPCEHCKGSGAEPGSSPRNCPACGGNGRKVIRSRRGGVAFQQITTCPVCHGRGKFYDKPCSACGGSGDVAQEEKLKIKIPMGVEEGMTLRVSGHGKPSRVPGGRPGDLYVLIHTQPDPRFERRGADLWSSASVTLADAALGTMLETETLEGPVSVKVPAGTQPEDVLRLRGKGVPEFDSGRTGDLFLRIRVHIPERLGEEERELFQRLRELEGRRTRKR